MAHKNTTCQDVNTPDEFDPSVLSRGQLVLMVIDLRQWLNEHRAKADREPRTSRYPSHSTEREQKASTQVNHQLLMQIKVLRELQ